MIIKKALAIIPARGQSKRIPKKNIKKFLGFPIIKYSIKAAIQSNCFDEIMVSTEDIKIANIAKQFGAKVPFYRSLKNADDFALTASVLEEVLFEYKKRNVFFDYFCCIYPTAPFVSSEDLKRTYKMLLQNNINGVIPIVRYHYPIQRSLYINNGKINLVFPENINTRSQDLQTTYHDAGLFYWLKTHSFFKEKRIFLSKCIPYEIPSLQAHDIDTLKDWKTAENKYNLLYKT